MMKKVVFLDLDNTLLPIDEALFYQLYFGELGRYFAPFGVNPKLLIDAILQGTAAMRANESEKTNMEVFWQTFSIHLPQETPFVQSHLKTFYTTKFPEVKKSASLDARSVQFVHRLQEKGLRLILATNPLFPALATHQRVAWAGLDVNMFEKITTMENAKRCKPNPEYFIELMKEAHVHADEVLMIGNDWVEDTAAARVGIQTTIVSDHATKEKPHDVVCESMTMDDLLLKIDSIL
jgi:FMN phosphatase YigB (HAD superfamily)